LVAPYNDPDAVEALLSSHSGQVAAIIVEPVAGNMSLVLPRQGYLEALRRLCDAHGALLIFDEVMTGFRVAPGGASERFGVRPDLVTLGKVIGGGLPVGAYGGRGDIMAEMAPAGPVYQAGTLSGNPVAMAAGIATLEILTAPGTHARVEEATARLASGLRDAAARSGVPIQVAHCGSMYGLIFSPSPARNYDEVRQADTGVYARWFHGMLNRGVYLAPSAFEVGFVSTTHGEAEILRTLEAAEETFAELARGS
jgi:glutamate-1-semialdehyde 2,1-aminomutase